MFDRHMRMVRPNDKMAAAAVKREEGFRRTGFDRRRRRRHRRSVGPIIIHTK